MPRGVPVRTVEVVARGHKYRLGHSDITQNALLQAGTGPLQTSARTKQVVR